MADIKDLQGFAEDIVPILKDLFPKASANRDAPPADAALAATRKLQKLVAGASTVTVANNVEAAEAVTAMRGSVLAVLIEAAKSKVALSETDANTLEVQFNALQARSGQLLTQAAFASIPNLIPAPAIADIEADLNKAAREIERRKKAKAVLDTVVQTIIAAARLAAKIAV
jgi:hypothetical protein